MANYDFSKNRNSIFMEESIVLSHQAYEGDQWILKLAAPKCAKAAQPGSFVHISCDPQRPLRRPISILQTNPSEGWIELLYKKLGEGTALLSQRKTGEYISILGPIGKGFAPSTDKSLPLLIGGGVGMPPMIFLAASLMKNRNYKPFCILGSEVPFPFTAEKSAESIKGISHDTTASMPLLNQWNIGNRLATLQNFSGCFQGYVTDLARNWLDALSKEERTKVEIFSCGPTPMLQAVVKVAAEYQIPSQVSLEEYMACAVGGCAGCVVKVKTTEGEEMQRVCVDGPVFDGAQVLF